jgi:OmcA/MtrC family decaheme c-type cytochrome
VKRTVLLGLSLSGFALALFAVLLISACQQQTQPAPAVATTKAASTPAPAQATASTTPAASPSATPASDLNATITKVDISADGKVTVSYKLTDKNGNPLSRSSLDPNRERFSIGHIVVAPDTGYTQWLSYVVSDVDGAVYKLQGKDTQPALAHVTGVPVATADSTGDFKEIAVGQYTYTLKTALPAGYDKNATTRVMYQASRNSVASVANATFDFVPAGTPVTVTRQVVATDNCNKCHDPLAVHGGSRRDTKMCVICHTPQNVDPASGNVVDFKVYIHKIHDDSNLPSVKAGKIFNVGSTDFSGIVWPQDIRNCTTCHSNAPNADNYKTNPSRAACGACHDQIDWTTGKSTIAGQPDHAAGPQADDKNCKVCHIPDSGKEFDASIVGAHTIPAKSKQLKGINYTLKAASVQPGQKATVDFNIKDDAGNAIDPNNVDSLSLVLAWPTTDYGSNLLETVNTIPAPGAAAFVRPGTLAPLSGGDYRYTFGAPVDASWKTGSVGVSIVGFKNITIKGNFGKDTVVREGNVNPVLTVSVDNTAPVARRAVVDRNKCNSCHLDLGSPAGLAIHGGARRNPQTCVECHIVTLTDEARHPKDMMPPESLQWKYLIHSIHMGDKRATATNFNGAINTQDIRFPGNPADCLKCHNAGTYTLPLPNGVLPATVTQNGQVIKIVQPITLACAGCHAGQPGFEAHVATNTSDKSGEACAVCHGRGRPFDVTLVHH